MSVDFDEFPLYEAIAKPGNQELTPVWVGAFSTFIQTLVTYLTSNGMFVPRLTSDERNSIQNIFDQQGNRTSPGEGQMIYNTTILAPQIFQNGAWKTFTTS